MEQFTCCVCGHTLPEHNFYKKRNGEIYSMCKSDFCKLYIDQGRNIDKACEILDIPKINQEIYYVVKKAKEDYNSIYFSGVCWFGKYVSKMKLKAFKQFTYKDSQWLNEVREEKINKTTPIGIRGVVWYKDAEVGKEKFIEIMNNYKTMKISIIKAHIVEECNNSCMYFGNGDIWYLHQGLEVPAHGLRFNIGYIDNQIDKTFVEEIILPMANLLPYNAIRFYN